MSLRRFSRGGQQIVDFLAAVRREPGHDQPGPLPGYCDHQPANRLAGRIVAALDAEDQLVIVVILLEQRPQIAFQIGVGPLAGRDQGDAPGGDRPGRN